MGFKWWGSAKDVIRKGLEEVAARDRVGARSIRRAAWRGHITLSEPRRGPRLETPLMYHKIKFCQVKTQEKAKFFQLIRRESKPSTATSANPAPAGTMVPSWMAQAKLFGLWAAPGEGVSLNR